MNNKLLFVRTIEHLQDAIVSDDDYTVIRSSLLIRQLLMDGASLAHIVNREFRLKLRFLIRNSSIGDISKLPKPLSWFIPQGLEPDRDTSNNIEVGWDKLQKWIVAIIHEHTYTVHDIVNHVAYISGGIHSGSPDTDKETALAGFDGIFPFIGINVLTTTLRSIGRIVLNGLEELLQKVLGVDKFENSSGVCMYIAFSPGPMQAMSENYIFDVGHEPDKNRISALIDSHGALCVRVCLSDGTDLFIPFGRNGVGYKYYQFSILCIEMSFSKGRMLLRIDNSVMCRLKQYNVNSTIRISSAAVVVGSDIYGQSKAHMFVLQYGFYDRYLQQHERTQIRDYLVKDIVNCDGSGVYYEPGAFHHSEDHSNFKNASLTERVNLGKDAVLCWGEKGKGRLISSIGPVPRLRKYR